MIPRPAVSRTAVVPCPAVAQRWIAGLWWLVASLAVSGCARIGAPTTTSRQTGATAQIAIANRTHEYPAPAPPAESAPGAPTPQAAVLAFATGYINWNARDVVADLTRLGHDSVGQARSAMQIEAADVAADYELHGGGISNSGTVEAVAAIRGSPEHYAVVTRESTSSQTSDAYQGLRPAWHVTLATVRQAGPRRWVLSGWQPES